MNNDHVASCPYCKKPVSYKWDGGFVSEPHNVLIADWVFHTECWDEMCKEGD
jgi:hypothetical protein